MAPMEHKVWKIPADLECVDSICADITRCLTENNLSTHLFPMQILAHEALNNAVLHGCNENPSLNIVCELMLDPDAIRLQVTDEGPGFDWHTYLLKGLPTDTQENGRGFTLYRMYADTIQFNQPGNQVLLIRQLRKENKK
jgi:serine/threonine-protein kinase RsbW